MKNWMAEFERRGADRLWDVGCKYLADTGREVNDYRGMLFLACWDAMREYNLHTAEGLHFAAAEVRMLIQAADLDDSGLREPFMCNGQVCIQQLSPDAWANLSVEEAQGGMRALQGD